MNRRLSNSLKDLPVAIASTLSGGLWAAVGIQYLLANNFPNFRVMEFSESLLLTGIGYAWTVLVLYSLGIYSAAWLIRRFYTRHEPSFRPLSLAWRGALGLILGNLLAWRRILRIGWSWDVFVFIGISSALFSWIACRNKEFTPKERQFKLRIGVPLLLTLSLFFLTYTGFPANASAQIRAQWGLKHLPSLYGDMSTFQNCKPIVDRIGQIQVVAPTKGPNFSVRDSGSNKFWREIELEVVGSRGTGVVNSRYPGPSPLSFTYQGKTEQIVCLNPVSSAEN